MKIIVAEFAFISLTCSVTLQCDFLQYSWATAGELYTCLGPVKTSDGNLNHVLNVTGNHNSGKSNANVRAFCANFYLFKDQPQLKRIPKGIEHFFPKLLVFQWGNGHLTSITAEDLKSFPVLKEIWLQGNKLVSLEDNLFSQTPKLEFVYLNNNKIINVGFGLLECLNNLQFAYFNENPCIDMYAQEDFSKLKFELQNFCPPLNSQIESFKGNFDKRTKSIQCSS